MLPCPSVSHLVDSAVLRPDVVEVLPLRDAFNVSLPPAAVLEDGREGGLVRTLLGDADADDAHVHGRVVLQRVANHQRLLQEVGGFVEN